MKWPFYLAYKLLILLAFTLYFPIILYKIILQGSDLRNIKERFGFLSKDKIKKIKNQPTIWIHTVSQEQFLAIEPLLKKLAKKYPNYKLLISTLTYNGQKIAYKSDIEIELIYFPLDFSWIMRRVVKKINPKLVLISETDLWPNFIRYAKKAGSKIMLVNGRVSDVSAERYNYLGPLMTDMINNIDFFTMQSKADAERILSLGADEAKVYQIGDIRFDLLASDELESIDELNFKVEEPIILVVNNLGFKDVSDICLMYKRLKDKVSNLLMVIIPESQLQGSEIITSFAETGAKIDFIKSCQQCISDFKQGQVVVAKADDDLESIYRQADLVLAGGSLNSESTINLSDAIAYTTPVIFGPYQDDFVKSKKSIFNYQMGIKVNSYQELIEALEYYLSQPDRITAKAELIKNTINANRLAVERNLTLIEEAVESS